MTLDSAGNRLSTNTELRYYPWGGGRYAAGATPTTFNFTGQRRDGGSGLLFYNARWYDPTVGRFISADTIVPQPGNPQSLNRYSYVQNNPLRFSDPTGMFSEDELIGWYGDQWRKLFSESWITFLLRAEFGDALTHGAETVVLARQDGRLTGWNVGSRSMCSIQGITADWNGNEVNLYRPQGANEHGGRTHTWGFGEGTNTEGVLSNSSNVYTWILGKTDVSKTLTLPLDWYRGGTSHIEVREHFAGFEMGPNDVVGLLGQLVTAGGAIARGATIGSAVLAGLGGTSGVVVLAVNLAAWWTVDTSYDIMPGSGTPYIVPVPTPPSRGGAPVP